MKRRYSVSNNRNESPQEPGLEPETPFLLDGAAPQNVPLPSELQAEVRIASNRDSALEERLEAYENIIDSEIGDTNLSRARNIERETGLRQLYLKFDGGNPTGHPEGPHRLRPGHGRDATRIRHHDRGHLRQLRRRGRLAASLRRSALRGLHPGDLPPDRGSTRCSPTAPRSCSTRETTRRRWRPRGSAPSATSCTTPTRAAPTPPSSSAPTARSPTRSTTSSATRRRRSRCRCPTAPPWPGSTGGSSSLYRRGKTSRMPRMVAGSSVGKNPIVQSFLKGLPHCEDLEPAIHPRNRRQRAAHQLALDRRRPRADRDPVVQRVGGLRQRSRHAAVRSQGARGRGSERPARVHRGSDRAARRTQQEPSGRRPLRRRPHREEA